MGWRYRGGAIFPCKADGKKILIKGFPDVVEVGIDIEIYTDWQLNLFVGKHIQFLLYDNDRILIGNVDGGIQLINEEQIIVGAASWTDTDGTNILIPIGYASGVHGELYKAVAAISQPRLIHSMNLSAKLKEPLSLDRFSYNEELDSEGISSVSRKISIFSDKDAEIVSNDSTAPRLVLEGEVLL